MCTKVKSPLWVISSVLLTAAVVLASAGPASAGLFDPAYRGDPNSVHAIFDWVSHSQADWETTLFEYDLQSPYPLANVQPSASDDGTETTIFLPNFIDRLPVKLMRVQLSFDGPVSGDLIAYDMIAHDPQGVQWQVVDGSGPVDSDFHWVDIEIYPNPDWEEIFIFGNTGGNVIPGNLLRIEVDTVSVPEPATLIVLSLGLLPILIGKSRKLKKQL